MTRRKANEISILAAGDFYDCGAPSSLGADKLFAATDALLERASLRVLNFESPACAKGKLEPIVKSGPALLAPETAPKLLRGRFDVALLANNHMLDYGGSALLRTIELLRKNGLKTVGAGESEEEASKPLTLDVEGRRVGILNACENEFSLARRDSPGCNGIDLHEICVSVARLRKSCDAVVVFLHSGNERNPLPSPKALSARRLIAESGATAIINSHPHVPQGIEIWKGVPIAHSLGNFVFKALRADELQLWRLAMPVLLTLDFSGRAVKASLEPEPFIGAPETAAPRLLTRRERKAFASWLAKISAPLKDFARIKDFFEAWSTESGASYFESLRHYRADCSALDGRRDFASFRNLWECESHNELVSVYVELLFRGRVEEARKLLPQVKAWQSGFPFES